MVTLQEQFERDFLDKSVMEINIREKYYNDKFTNWDLDLKEYKDLEILNLDGNNITSINLFGCEKLKKIILKDNNLTSVDFLNTLPNLDKLEWLFIYNNNIQPTDIEVFSRLVNLRRLKIGSMDHSLHYGKRNKFYGSLKAYQNLTKLEEICIEATDVDSGLEYLPSSLAKSTKGGNYHNIECSPRDNRNTNAKCKVIQDQLRPFNYDIEAWQLAHPELMEKAKLEISNSERVQKIVKKITEAKEEFEQVKQENPEKEKKIQRLESKLELLEKELDFLAQENKELKEKNSELEKKVFSLVQKLEQINLISQTEIPPK